MLQDLLNTPVTSIDPDSNPITPGDHEIALEKVRTDMSNDDPTKVYRYSLSFRVVSGDFAGRPFFDDIYPYKRDGDKNPVAAKQIISIITGALGSLDAVAGRNDPAEVLEEIANAVPPLTWTQRLKNEVGRDNKTRTRLAV